MGKAIKSILVSQPKPENNKSPFFGLSNKHDVTVDFRSFIHVEGVDAKEFREQKINLADFTAVIFPLQELLQNSNMMVILMVSFSF